MCSKCSHPVYLIPYFSHATLLVYDVIQALEFIVLSKLLSVIKDMVNCKWKIILISLPIATKLINCIAYIAADVQSPVGQGSLPLALFITGFQFFFYSTYISFSC